MALHVGLRQPEALAGIIALSGYLLQPDAPTPCSSNVTATQLFMAHGINDPVVPYALGDAARRTLESLNYSVQWRSYPMEHNVCPEEISHIGAWISAILAR